MTLIVFIVVPFIGAVCFLGVHPSFLVRFLFGFGSMVFGGVLADSLFGG